MVYCNVTQAGWGGGGGGDWGGDGGEERGGAQPIRPVKLGVAGDREKRHGAEVNGENCANLIQ